MDDSIQIFNLQIDNIKSNMLIKRMQAYLQSDTLDVIEFVTMDTLLLSEEQEHLHKSIEQCELVLPGDKEILKAIEAGTKKAKTESDIHSTWKNLARYMDRRKIKVFLLADSDEQLQKISTYTRKNYHGMRIVGAGALKEDMSEEFIVNKINAATADCVIAFLPSPLRETFATDNRAWMNAKVWIGLDSNLVKKESTPANSIHTLIMRLLFHRKMIKEKKENIES